MPRFVEVAKRLRIPVVEVLACIGVGAISPALADPSTTAPAQTEPSTAATTPTTPAPAAPQAAPAAAAATTAYDPADERRLRAAGYKPEMHNGQKVWCRAEQTLGSRLAAQKNCGTAKTLAISEQESERMISDAQRKTGPYPKGN